MATYLLLALATALFLTALWPLFREPESIDAPAEGAGEAVDHSLQELRTDVQLSKLDEADYQEMESFLRGTPPPPRDAEEHEERGQV